MTQYLQRLLYRAAPPATLATLRPSLPTRSPIAETDQRLHDPDLAPALLGAQPSAASDAFGLDPFADDSFADDPFAGEPFSSDPSIGGPPDAAIIGQALSSSGGSPSRQVQPRPTPIANAAPGRRPQVSISPIVDSTAGPPQAAMTDRSRPPWDVPSPAAWVPPLAASPQSAAATRAPKMSLAPDTPAATRTPEDEALALALALGPPLALPPAPARIRAPSIAPGMLVVPTMSRPRLLPTAIDAEPIASTAAVESVAPVAIPRLRPLPLPPLEPPAMSAADPPSAPAVRPPPVRQVEVVPEVRPPAALTDHRARPATAASISRIGPLTPRRRSHLVFGLRRR
jgi:hypothetical protein